MLFHENGKISHIYYIQIKICLKKSNLKICIMIPFLNDFVYGCNM